MTPSITPDNQSAALTQQHSSATPPPNVAAMYEKPAPEGWMAELQAGNIKQAQELLERQMAEAVKPQLEQELLSRTADVVRAELDTRQFVDGLRAQMPEVKPLEPYIGAYVERRMAVEAQNAGTIAEYVEKYKQIVQEEMQKARDAIQQLRAAGKEEALQTKSEVLSASMLPKPEGDKGVVTNPQPQPLSPEEYYRARMQQHLRTKGIAT